MAGSNAINYYSLRIFRSIRLTGTKTILVSIGVYGIVRLVAVFFAIYFVVDRFSRKPMLIFGSIAIVSTLNLPFPLIGFMNSSLVAGGFYVAHWRLF